ncbi:MAG: hypothetical protein AAFU69_10090 [Pseudomonadota bacterium]
MLRVFCVFALLGCVFGGVAPAFAQYPDDPEQLAYEDYGDYRFYATRRHNDIQGVEAVFDDYRRGWLNRYNSEILVGANPNKHQSDIPFCSRSANNLDQRMNRTNCGSGHVVRSNIVGFTADNEGETKETGGIGYLGYEYMFSDRFFLGVGSTFSKTNIDHTSNGHTLDIKTQDVALHLLGGYRFQNESMAAWNVSYVRGNDDIVRDDTVTGDVTYNTVQVTGVWYKNFDIRPDLHMNLGIDYTLQIFGSDKFTESNGIERKVPSIWRGDFTTSLLFTKDFEGAEAFARLGSSFEALNPSDQSFDFTADLGGSVALTDKIALTGSVGGMLRTNGYQELRGTARIASKF